MKRNGHVTITARRIRKDGREINGRIRKLVSATTAAPGWKLTADDTEYFTVMIPARNSKGEVEECFNVYLNRELAESVVAFWNEKLSEPVSQPSTFGSEQS